jgi:hypothetical protein
MPPDEAACVTGIDRGRLIRIREGPLMPRIAAFLAAVLLGVAGAMVAAAQSDPAPAACPDRLAGTPSLVCSCTADATRSGGVWGSDLYTDDSHVCRAAVHAGVIGEGGGTVWVFERPGLGAYPAVTRNGVPSSSWPAWRRSIAFRPASEAVIADDTEPRAEACPENLAGRPEGTMVTCTCSIEAMSRGSIWGDGAYTADSILCRAARHTGAIGRYGGTVRARLVAGRPSYAAATRNGITSGSWASYRTSLSFDLVTGPTRP